MFAFRYPAVVVLIFVILGTLLGGAWDINLPLLVFLLSAAILILIGAYFRLAKIYFVVPVAIVSLAGALFQANIKYHSFAPDDVSKYLDSRQPLGLFAKIEKWPVIKQHQTILTCRIDSVVCGNLVSTASGLVLVTVRRETTHFSLEDKIYFKERLYSPHRGAYPGEFDYGRYLWTKGIRGTAYVNEPSRILISQTEQNLFGRAISDFRQWIFNCFYTNLSPLSAAIASGFFVGETHNIPKDLYQAFRQTGTLHLLAVSGSNVALVLLVIIGLMRFFPMGRWWRSAILLAIIVIFCNLSYNQPSVIRASLMAGLILTAQVLYRRAELNNIIAATAAFLILFDPGNLYDVGFQLSFSVAWSLILFLPMINRRFEKLEMSAPSRYILLIVSSSFVASLIATPITAYYFGQASLVTVFSNLIIVPLVSLAVIGIMILLLTNFVFPALAIIPGMLLDRLLTLVSKLVWWFGESRLSSLAVPSFPGVYVLVLMGILALFFLSFDSRSMRRWLVFSVLAAVNLYLAIDLLTPIDTASVELFNRRGGQTLIMNRGGGVVVYRQNRNSQYNDFASNLIPYLKIRKWPIPRYFLFLEPRFQTEQKLEQLSGDYPDLHFQPAAVTPPSWPLSLWKTSRSTASSTDTVSAITISGGFVTFDLEDSCRMVLAEPTGQMRYPQQAVTSAKSYYLFFCDDDSDLATVLGRPDLTNSLIVLGRPIGEFKVLSDSMVTGRNKAIDKWLVEIGEDRLFRLRDID